MQSVPPTGGSPEQPSPAQPTGSTPAPPANPGGGGQTMTEFMKQFTPEQRKKLDQIMNQNFANELSREKRVHEQNKEYRKEMDPDDSEQ
jgi:hypothetical protein